MLKYNMTETIYHLTEQGLKALQKEYEVLQNLRRAKAQEETPQALHSEELDTEFVAYREDMEFLEARIVELEYVLKHVSIIKPPRGEEKKKINLGASVRLAVNGQEDEFLIVGTLEADPNLGKISNESPVGKALLGHKAGDEVAVDSNMKTTYKIIKVNY